MAGTATKTARHFAPGGRRLPCLFAPLAPCRRLYAWLLLVLATPCLAVGGIHVKANTGLTGVRIEAATWVAADTATLWETLTDYDRLASFVPDLRASRLVSAPGQPKLVEQRADAGLFAFVMPDHVVLAMEERPRGSIRFHAVAGNVAAMRGEWVIGDDGERVKLTYRAHVVPLLPPPPLLSDNLVEAEIRQRLGAVVREAERRMQMRTAAGKS